MSKDEELYMVVDDSVYKPMSESDKKKVQELNNDPEVQAVLREFEKELKAKYGY